MIYDTSNPCLSSVLHVSNIAGCSIFEVIIWFPFSLLAYANPFNAILSLSEPPPVKYISLWLQFNNSATLFLAFSIALLALLPTEYNDEAFPYSVVKYGIISCKTSDFIGVVALLSKYIIFI